MSINITKTPAITPAFGMPVYASTAHKCVRTWNVEAAVVAHVALATDAVQATRPGSHAWSPPIS